MMLSLMRDDLMRHSADMRNYLAIGEVAFTPPPSDAPWKPAVAGCLRATSIASVVLAEMTSVNVGDDTDADANLAGDDDAPLLPIAHARSSPGAAPT
jgi:hypothetical protein